MSIRSILPSGALTVLLSVSPVLAQGPTTPVASPVEFFARLDTCFRPPREAAGSSLTLRFGVGANGELRGKPVISHSSLRGPADVQRAFVAAALGALAECLPIPMTESLAAVVKRRVTVWTARYPTGPFATVAAAAAACRELAELAATGGGAAPRRPGPEACLRWLDGARRSGCRPHVNGDAVLRAFIAAAERPDLKGTSNRGALAVALASVPGCRNAR